MKLTDQQREIYDEIISREKAKTSLHEFCRQAWPQIEGDKPFVDGWHIGAVCEHLEALYNRQIKNLIVNVPPRTSKSSIISVCLPAWVWINNPQEQFLYASYAASLSIRDAVKCRRLIQSPWFQIRWGEVFKLVGDQNTKARYDNDKTGYRISLGIDGSATGEGGSFLVCDDPNNAKDGESEAMREATINWWCLAWSLRLNDPKKDCRLVVQQRLHQKDISGYIMSNDESKNWTTLILPMEYEVNRKCKTIILPSSKGQVWQDPREVEGELLCPTRMGPKEIVDYKNLLGSEYAISGQLQQSPSPSGGGIIKKTWYKWWKYSRPPKLEHVIQSWDTALSEKDRSGYSACTTWGIFKNDNKVMNLILLSMWRGRVEYPDLRRIAIRMYNDYLDDDLDNPIKPSSNRVPDVVLVECKSSGISLIHDFQRAGIVATRFDPNKFGDKIERVRKTTHILENDRIYVPAKPPDFNRLREFADLFVEQAGSFPNAESRDLVDTQTQVILRLMASGWLTHTSDQYQEEEPVAVHEAYY